MKSIFTLLLSLVIATAYAQKDYSFVYQTDSILKKGVQLHEQKKYDDAIKEFNRIAKTDPKYLVAQYEKALSLSQTDKPEELSSHLEKFHGRMPEYPGLYIIYGTFLSDEKKYVEAEKVFKEGETITETCIKIWLRITPFCIYTRTNLRCTHNRS